MRTASLGFVAGLNRFASVTRSSRMFSPSQRFTFTAFACHSSAEAMSLRERTFLTSGMVLAADSSLPGTEDFALQAFDKQRAQPEALFFLLHVNLLDHEVV